MKMIMVLLVALAVTGCSALATPPTLCTGFIKTKWLTGDTHYSVKVIGVREIGYRFPHTQFKTKYGWLETSEFDFKYGDCKHLIN